MKKVKLTKKELNSLKCLSINNKVLNTESIIYRLKKDKILKKLYYNSKENIESKSYTIDSLNSLLQEVELPELVVADAIAFCDNSPVGFVSDYITGDNLLDIIYNKDVSHNEKIQLFKQIGELLVKLQKIRDNKIEDEVFIGDLHEGNFLVDQISKKIKLVDTDSMKIAGNDLSPSKYLVANKNLDDTSLKLKYLNHGILKKVNENSDLFCYNTIILNYICHGNISEFSINDYYNYLEYLNSLGYSKNILDVFNKIYTSDKNENPLPYLGELPDNFMSHKNIFFAKQRKK